LAAARGGDAGRSAASQQIHRSARARNVTYREEAKQTHTHRHTHTHTHTHTHNRHRHTYTTRTPRRWLVVVGHREFGWCMEVMTEPSSSNANSRFDRVARATPHDPAVHAPPAQEKRTGVGAARTRTATAVGVRTKLFFARCQQNSPFTQRRSDVGAACAALRRCRESPPLPRVNKRMAASDAVACSAAHRCYGAG
jgi:hypothetical protein